MAQAVAWLVPGCRAASGGCGVEGGAWWHVSHALNDSLGLKDSRLDYIVRLVASLISPSSGLSGDLDLHFSYVTLCVAQEAAR